MLAIQKAEEEERDAGAVRRWRSPAEQQDFLERLVVQVARAFGVAAGELQAVARSSGLWPAKAGRQPAPGGGGVAGRAGLAGEGPWRASDPGGGPGGWCLDGVRASAHGSGQGRAGGMRYRSR